VPPNAPLSRNPCRAESPRRRTLAQSRSASAPPVIDGKDDDAVWRATPVISAFKQWQPTREGTPLPHEAKVAYDAANLYVFVRAFDPRPTA